MNIEKYSERVRGFVQYAQTYALAQGSTSNSPQNMCSKVLLDDDKEHGRFADRARQRRYEGRAARQ